MNIEESKFCTTCGQVKPHSDFNKHSHNKDGLISYCKLCQSDKQKKYVRTKEGLLGGIYCTQRRTSKRRGYDAPSYSLNEFRLWAMDNPDFNKQYVEWVLSGYEKMSIPSADRLDDYKPYTFDNLQWLSWAENKAKGEKDKIEGINNKHNKEVLQFTLEGDFVISHHSMHQAERVTGVEVKNISSCCLGKRKTAGGFIWRTA